MQARAFRPITAALAFFRGAITRCLVWHACNERPIGDLVEALRQAGADIEYNGQPGVSTIKKYRPASIDTSNPIKIRGDVSSQFFDCITHGSTVDQEYCKH